MIGTTRQALADALSRLGLDPAAELRRLGIKGHAHECHRCPVAAYLTRELGLQCEDVYVNALDVAVGKMHGTTVIGVLLGLPDHLSDFVERFDAGEFPDLVLEGE